MTTPWKGDEKIPPEYMPIADAYAYVELVIDGEAEDANGNSVNAWRMISGGGRNPAKVTQLLRDQIKREVANPFPGQSAKTTASLVRAVGQSELPLFLTYIAGKMGAV